MLRRADICSSSVVQVFREQSQKKKKEVGQLDPIWHSESDILISYIILSYVLFKDACLIGPNSHEVLHLFGHCRNFQVQGTSLLMKIIRRTNGHFSWKSTQAVVQKFKVTGRVILILTVRYFSSPSEKIQAVHIKGTCYNIPQMVLGFFAQNFAKTESDQRVIIIIVTLLY